MLFTDAAHGGNDSLALGISGPWERQCLLVGCFEVLDDQFAVADSHVAMLDVWYLNERRIDNDG